jgi:hypothetical protein
LALRLFYRIDISFSVLCIEKVARMKPKLTRKPWLRILYLRLLTIFDFRNPAKQP